MKRTAFAAQRDLFTHELRMSEAFCLFLWLFGWLAGWLVGWLVRLLGWSVGWLVRLLAWLVVVFAKGSNCTT